MKAMYAKEIKRAKEYRIELEVESKMNKNK